MCRRTNVLTDRELMAISMAISMAMPAKRSKMFDRVLPTLSDKNMVVNIKEIPTYFVLVEYLKCNCLILNTMCVYRRYMALFVLRQGAALPGGIACRRLQ